MKRFVYADNAATTRIDDDVVSSMMPFLVESYGNPSQPYSFGIDSKKALARARETIAGSIGAEPSEIVFTSGGTESDNWAIKCFSSNRKAVIITSSIEHHAILRACESLSEDTRIIQIPVDQRGIVSKKNLSEVLSNVYSHDCNMRVLVSIMTANNEIGTIQPIADLVKLSHSYGALFHTDAVQAVGHIPINVKELGVDMLSASAHKFNGPKGIGFLFIKNGTDISPLIDGGSQESRRRAGTENVASIVGMSVALRNNTELMHTNTEHILELENKLISKLNSSNIDYIRNGSPDHIPGNISLSFKNKEGEMILHRLDLKGICVSTGSACDSVNTQVSHVIKSICVDEKYAKGTIRISLGKNNTLDEIDYIASELIRIING